MLTYYKEIRKLKVFMQCNINSPVHSSDFFLFAIKLKKKISAYSKIAA